MSDNLFRINRGISLNPQASAPASPVNGDVYYDSSLGTYVLYNNGFWINLASQGSVVSAASLTSANFTAVIMQNSMVRITGSTVCDIHGFTATANGKPIILYNGSSATITLHNNSGTEPTATNRILIAGSANMLIASGYAVIVSYDSSQARWITVPSSSMAGLVLNGLTSGNITQHAADTTTSYSIKWPNAQGPSGTVPTNDGSGNLVWQNPTSASQFLQPTSLPYTIMPADNGAIFTIDTTGGPGALTLPGSPIANFTFKVKDIGGAFGTNPVTLTRAGSEKIELLAANYLLQANYGEWQFISNGTDWYIVG